VQYATIPSKGLRQAIHAVTLVKRRPLRSSLTSVGVAAATCAALIAVAVAERGRRAALDEITRMGADIVTVRAREQRSVGGRTRSGGIATTLTRADADEIGLRVPGVTAVVAKLSGSVPAKFGGLQRRTTVSGVEAMYGVVRRGEVTSGRFFTQEEEKGAQRVAVLGATVAENLYGALDPVGQVIRLQGIRFTVIGVLPERGSLGAFNEDEAIFVPLKTALRRLFNVQHLEGVYVQVSEPGLAPQVTEAIRWLLSNRHRPDPDGREDFQIDDQERLAGARYDAAQRLRTFQLLVGGALIVIGAGGIFALQVMSVRERRKEIGTRRALGASRWEIFSQFMTEAWVVGLTGASLGVLLAGGIAMAVDLTIPRMLPTTVWLGLLTVCLVAAAIPAREASGMLPAEALRAH